MAKRPPGISEQEWLELDSWAKEAAEHWYEHRPKMYKGLLEKGLLVKSLQEASERTADACHELMSKGVNPLEAWQMVREEWLFLPSEKDEGGG